LIPSSANTIYRSDEKSVYGADSVDYRIVCVLSPLRHRPTNQNTPTYQEFQTLLDFQVLTKEENIFLDLYGASDGGNCM